MNILFKHTRDLLLYRNGITLSRILNKQQNQIITIRENPSLWNSLCFSSKLFFAYGERGNEVQTHRGEFLPLKFNTVWDNPRSRKKKKRLGRGPGSGKGKTSGRGQKGYRARHRGPHPRFEGGQTPITRRIPKWGVPVRNIAKFSCVTIEKILYYIDMGRIDPTKPITIKELYMSESVKKVKYGVKILGKGLDKLKIPLHFEVNDASESVIKRIKELGGSVKAQFMTPLQIKYLINPTQFQVPIKTYTPTYKQVTNLERIRKRGADVYYKQPVWQKEQQAKSEEEKDKQTKDQQEDKKQPKKEDNFKFPAERYPGMGLSKIRKRRPPIWRTISYEIGDDK